MREKGQIALQSKALCFQALIFVVLLWKRELKYIITLYAFSKTLETVLER